MHSNSSSSESECDKPGGDLIYPESLGGMYPHAEPIPDCCSVVASTRRGPSVATKTRNIIVLDKKRVMELERELKETKTKLQEVFNQQRFLQSRNTIVERSLMQHREDLKTLLKKDELNNRLIAELKSKCHDTPF